MKSIKTIAFCTMLVIGNTNAAAGPPNQIRHDILTHAHAAKSGVIVAVTERGNMAEEAAWLLSAQVVRDNSYAPLLVVLDHGNRSQVFNSLKLRENSLPALIFYNRKGGEISRVIGTLPSSSIKQVPHLGS